MSLTAAINLRIAGVIVTVSVQLARADAPDRLIAPLPICTDLRETHLQCELRVEFFVG